MFACQLKRKPFQCKKNQTNKINFNTINQSINQQNLKDTNIDSELRLFLNSDSVSEPGVAQRQERAVAVFVEEHDTLFGAA